jgi:hypothetical protein
MEEMSADWIFVNKKMPTFGKKVEIFHEFFGTLVAKRVSFAIPTRNPFTKIDEFWYWDVIDSKAVEVLLLNEVAHWRPL